LSSSLPDPPSSSSLHPLLFVWEKGRPFIRCHNVRFGATVFNPGKGRGGRFHPFPGARGRIVPTLYAADHLDGALAETVFHSVPVRGPERRIRRSVLKSMTASTLTCRRDLTLAQLFGFGLRRLEISRLELIETERDDYPRTTSWGKALHECDPRIDGLIWVSRQNDGVRSLVLFGDRVPSSSLRATGPSRPLDTGPGYAEVCRAADEAGILIFD
jgi:hypothetical protein